MGRIYRRAVNGFSLLQQKKKRMIWISSGWIDVQFYSVTEYKDRKEMYIESAYCSSDRNSKCGCDPFFFFSFFFFLLSCGGDRVFNSHRVLRLLLYL